LLCFILSGGAAAAGHRERAQVAENTGRIARAAREYEEAYGEEGAPELLYRLGVVRRKLKQYALAQEAFRGYLRAAPDGPLREEVKRQLSALGVLLEEQRRHALVEQRKNRRPPRPATEVKDVAPPAAQPSAASATTAIPRPGEPATSGLDATTTATPNEPSSSTVASTDVDEAPATLAVAPRPPPQMELRPRDAAPPSTGTAAPVAAADGTTEAPISATHATLTHAASSPSRAAPWVAAGAAALAVGGAALWWDGDRTSSGLDARYASGDLGAADGGSYGRARRESIAGRALVAGAAVLGAVAVALWW
jgi:hypothetical protein